MNRELKNKIAISSMILLLLFISGNSNAQTDTVAFIYQKPLFDFDYKKPVFNLSDEQLSNKNRLLRYSVITGYREGVKSINGAFGTNFLKSENKDNGTYSFKIYNVSIVDMLALTHINQSQVILNVKNPSKYIYDPKYGSQEEWLRKNGYCFELMMPSSALVNPLENAKQELSSLFNIRYGWEKRKAQDPKNGEMKEMNILVVSEIER